MVVTAMVEKDASKETMDTGELTEEVAIVLETVAGKSGSRKRKVDNTTDEVESKKKTTEEMIKKQTEKHRLKELREAERIEREKRREEDRLQKEEEKQRRLEERQRKEQERDLKKKQALEEKLEKERKREEEKLERERKREEERIRKQHEKDERERQRINKKLKLEEEKQRKEQERQEELEKKRKKEDRSQMKISNFFTVKSSTSKANNKPITTSTELSVSELKSESHALKPDTGKCYEKKFLPFFVKETTRMSPTISLSASNLAKSVADLDNQLFGKAEGYDDYFQGISKSFLSLSKVTTSNELVSAINSSDVTESQIQAMIANLPPIKYLEFYENAKPPYIGTWCSSKHIETVLPIEDPLNEAITGLDYTYDSDLDWNEDDDDEGEDIDEDDDDDDDEEEDEEEMVDFLDDEAGDGGPKEKSRTILGPLVATCIWGRNDNENINDDDDDNNNNNTSILDTLRYEMLIPTKFPIEIDRNYWDEAKSPSTPKKGNSVTEGTKPMISEDKDIFQLIQFIEKNNEFSVNVLVELAKKELGTAYTKALVKSTIQGIATYSKKAGKWEIKLDIRKMYFSKYGKNGHNT
ncbi:chromatin assembly factor-I (CAF-I) p90 subunit [Scheffersomyces spartinae]|uniref:Chromatin assembly factor-I (CAF-I) p90 subunit n=1 Tax=Scheffersomyces spartinae TaxID=45513 RepID=A0A9P7V9I0_9ASCO|nr:chromatin assembly factor-I (CAF-I) p90 subunit [Scheffersomyces spartinae]KAG7193699.1 chromatin assembly factor-I (CAF-I) p90 subunit [Scheffersomyces spartinae]